MNTDKLYIGKVFKMNNKKIKVMGNNYKKVLGYVFDSKALLYKLSEDLYMDINTKEKILAQEPICVKNGMRFIHPKESELAEFSSYVYNPNKYMTKRRIRRLIKGKI